MDENSLLVIILAFIVGCMCSGMMKQMCGYNLVEGNVVEDDSLDPYTGLPLDPDTKKPFNCTYGFYDKPELTNRNYKIETRLEYIADNFESLSDFLNCNSRNMWEIEKKVYDYPNHII